VVTSFRRQIDRPTAERRESTPADRSTEPSLGHVCAAFEANKSHHATFSDETAYRRPEPKGGGQNLSDEVRQLVVPVCTAPVFAGDCLLALRVVAHQKHLSGM
jgi:hypothetical protein